jgi:hypothetical protein
MEHAKLTALEVERAHRSGKRLLLGDGDGLYLRKQTGNNASWVLRYRHCGRQRWLTWATSPTCHSPPAFRMSRCRRGAARGMEHDPRQAKRASGF